MNVSSQYLYDKNTKREEYFWVMIHNSNSHNIMYNQNYNCNVISIIKFEIYEQNNTFLFRVINFTIFSIIINHTSLEINYIQ